MVSGDLVVELVLPVLSLEGTSRPFVLSLVWFCLPRLVGMGTLRCQGGILSMRNVFEDLVDCFEVGDGRVQQRYFVNVLKINRLDLVYS